MNAYQLKPNGPRKKIKKLILTTRDKLRMKKNNVHDSLDKLFGKSRTPSLLPIPTQGVHRMTDNADVKIKPIFVSPLDDTAYVPAKKPRTTLWDRIKNWYWNWKRRPEVRRKQAELLQLANQIKRDLKIELLPQLWQLRLVCATCRDNFAFLRSEVFVSTIKTILERMRCADHADPYLNFLIAHGGDFERNDHIAAWINGFKN